jgi:hypothetical protein
MSRQLHINDFRLLLIWFVLGGMCGLAWREIVRLCVRVLL